MTTSTCFIKIFGGKKLITKSNIPVFTQGQDPKKHIDICEKEWRRLGYKDEKFFLTYFQTH